MRLSFSCLFLSPLPFFFFYKYIVKLPIIQNDWTQTVRSNTLESCDPCSPILSLVFFAALLRALKKKKRHSSSPSLLSSSFLCRSINDVRLVYFTCIRYALSFSFYFFFLP